MLFGYSTRHKWTEIDASCLEYTNLFYDIVEKVYICVLDSDLAEFREEYADELKKGLLLEIFMRNYFDGRPDLCK